MKRTLLIAALFLGFSASTFAKDALVVGSKVKESISTEEQQVSELDRFTVLDQTTGEFKELIVENPYVTVNPGETITISTDDAGNEIAIKVTGEFIGKVQKTLSGWVDSFLT